MLRNCPLNNGWVSCSPDKASYDRIPVAARMPTKLSSNNLIMDEVFERESHDKADLDSVLPLGVGFESLDLCFCLEGPYSAGSGNCILFWRIGLFGKERDTWDIIVLVLNDRGRGASWNGQRHEITGQA